MDEARQRITHQRPTGLELPQIALIYLIIDQLVDSFFPMLDKFDGQIDELEDAILVKPTDAQLGTLFTMKRSLITIRKVITPQRDMFASITSGVIELPGVSADGQRYMRDIYDHLIRISDLVDGYRDLLSGVMDTHLSTVSNRLNVVMKQLTIIATVFLPLSFLTGFFGQNFSFLVGHITGRLPVLRLRHRARGGLGRRPAVPVPQAGLARRSDRLSAVLPVPRRHDRPHRPVGQHRQHRGAREDRGHPEETAHRGDGQRRPDRAHRGHGPDRSDRQDRPLRVDAEEGVGRVDRPPGGSFGGGHGTSLPLAVPCPPYLVMTALPAGIDARTSGLRRWSAPGRWPCPGCGPGARSTGAIRCR